jgi:hypothetical protein
MEIYIDIWVEDRESGNKLKPTKLFTHLSQWMIREDLLKYQIIPETELKQRFEAALRRKQLSLVLAGKLNPHDATELKALFT